MDDMDHKRFFIKILVLICFAILFSIVLEADEPKKQMTTCRLASQLLQGDTRICVFVGANHTQYREYVPYDAGECPRNYQCPYRPNEKPFNLKNVIKSIKDQFK
tara:strand:+ start:26 stop:337 length:312 start_codon:yes stop_codon:yes gene_type:complete